MNGNGSNGGDVGGFGDAAGTTGGPSDPMEVWSHPYPETLEERIKHFNYVQWLTARELIKGSPDGWKLWYNLLKRLPGFTPANAEQFIYEAIICHKERIYPMVGAWTSVFGLTAAEVSKYFINSSIYFGKPTTFMVSSISVAYGLKGYELELKVDEFIAKIGNDFRVGRYIQADLAGAASRAKTRARIRKVVMTISIVLLTYGLGESLGINSKVSTEMAAAKAEYVKGNMWAQLKGWIKVIEAGLKAFLTAIKYDALRGIHEIAYLTSKDYRATVNKVYIQLSKASEALGLGPHYLQLFMQNARNLVLVTSTAMGRSYDVAQMEWYSAFDEYLGVFNTRAYRYKANPELLFYDLEQLIERPTLDVKGAGSRAVFDSILGLVEKTKETVVEIKKFSDSVDKLVFDLPENIKKEIEPQTSKITQKVDDFIVNTYEPYIGILDMAIVEIRGQNETMRGNLSGVIGRLARPADYLLEIDSMEWVDKFEQERKLSEITSRRSREEADLLSKEVAPEYEHLSSIAEAWEKITLTPIEFPTEIETPVHPPGVEPEPRETWFVGDY